MSPQQAAVLVGALKAAFPRADWDETTVRLYVQSMLDLDFNEAEPAIRDLIFTNQFPPTISEIRRRYADRVLQLPSPVVAWELVCGPERAEPMPEVVRRTLAAVGGSWAVRTSEKPEILRAQFVSSYEAFAEEARMAIVAPSQKQPLPAELENSITFEPLPIE